MTPDPYALDLAPVGSDLGGSLMLTAGILVAFTVGIILCRRSERQKQNRLREHRKNMWQKRRAGHVKHVRASRDYQRALDDVQTLAGQLRDAGDTTSAGIVDAAVSATRMYPSSREGQGK